MDGRSSSGWIVEVYMIWYGGMIKSELVVVYVVWYEV
jgi:hypothetical protein